MLRNKSKRFSLEQLETRDTPSASVNGVLLYPPATTGAAPVVSATSATPIGSPKVAASVAASVAAPKPVLLVIANQDFYYQEYNDTRNALMQAGVGVTVAAGTLSTCRPHANSGQGSATGYVTPDIGLTSAQAANYSAIAFVGGWGASAYQYGFSGTYVNAAYNGTAAIRAASNQLINDFVAQGKYVAGLCHGTSVLAWARVNGQSPIAGHTVSTYQGTSPGFMMSGQQYPAVADSWHEQQNSAAVFAPNSIGNTSTDTDDVFVDGKIITGQNWNSARRFGDAIAQAVKSL